MRKDPLQGALRSANYALPTGFGVLRLDPASVKGERTGRMMRRSPQRSCVGCRAVRGKKELVRVVHTPEDRFILDPVGKLAGRGAYVCPDPACLASAVKRKSFDRAFRQPVPREAVAALEAGILEYLRARAGDAESNRNDEG